MSGMVKRKQTRGRRAAKTPQGRLDTQRLAKASIINDGHGINMLDKQDDQCSYPIAGESVSLHFCGAPVFRAVGLTNKQYCFHHQSITNHYGIDHHLSNATHGIPKITIIADLPK